MIYKGKQKCKTLKSIRRKIADANEIVYEPKECTHEGDCAGTCPACEAEVKYLERQLSLRRMAGKAVAIVGLSLGLTAMSGCKSRPVDGSESCQQQRDSSETEVWMGEVVADTIETSRNLVDPSGYAEMPEEEDQQTTGPQEKKE